MIKDMERNEQKIISTNPVFRKENDGVEITITFAGEEDNSVTKDAILDILFHAYETRLNGAVL